MLLSKQPFAAVGGKLYQGYSLFTTENLCCAIRGTVIDNYNIPYMLFNAYDNTGDRRTLL